jgi:hypothetical protein
MDRQNNYYAHGSKPRYVPQQQAGWLSANDVPETSVAAGHTDGGYAMAWSQSNESTDSSKYSGPPSTPGTSPGIAMSTTGTPPQFEYASHLTSNNYVDNSFNYESDNKAMILQNSDPYQQDRLDTPSTLNWHLRPDLIKLYAFVVKKGKKPYFELLPEWTPTYGQPEIVNLDKPM